MLLLQARDLLGLLRPVEIIAAVESALRADQAGSICVPQRSHVSFNGNTTLTMPAAAEICSGVKVVSVAPANASRGLPVISGIMLLNDPVTAVPLAIMDAATLTAQRTGAVGALGVKYLTPSDTSSIGIVGCGTQGAWQAIFSCVVRDIRCIHVLHRSSTNFDKFVAMVRHHAPDVEISATRDVHELLKLTDVIIAATTSSEPVLPDDPELLRDKHFISVGSFKPSMQELPDSVFRLAGSLVLDSNHARHEVGDVINPLQKGLLKESDVFSIAEFVAGVRTPDIARTTAYKSVGNAMYDLFVAHQFYRAAVSKGIGQALDL